MLMAANLTFVEKSGTLNVNEKLNSREILHFLPNLRLCGIEQLGKPQTPSAENMWGTRFIFADSSKFRTFVPHNVRIAEFV